ncbi:DUF6612 family protein [Streptococcus caviae]|uniref:DUF6612 family protein n=1 Tax=Streptococcus sp. 'caviae' TaxID=1915004 RepID=UPI0015D669CA|nr:DUF6612 family protein [Streptococcus sp. 'caviae']
MKKKYAILLTVLAALLLVTGCVPQRVMNSGQKQQTSRKTSKKISIEDFLDKVEEANDEIETVHFDMNTNVNSNGRKIQHMVADLGYDSSGDIIEKANVVIDETLNGANQYQEIVGDQNTARVRTSKDGSWKTANPKGRYTVRPSYFNFLKVLYSMEDDLVLKQRGSEYKLTLRSQNVDLVSLFREELSLYIRGISQSELKKDFEVTFDKKTFYLKNFNLQLSYNGQRGQLDIEADGTFSKWNKVKDSQFSVSDSTSDDSDDSDSI